MSIFFQNKKEEGQIALIIVMVSVVVLTIGLAIAARITADVRIASQSKDSSLAMYAAESGIEYALTLDPGVNDCSLAKTIFNDKAKTDCEIVYFQPEKDEVLNYGKVPIGETRTIWLVGHDANEKPLLSGPKYSGRLDVTWVPNTGSDVEMIVIFDTTGAGDYRVDRFLERGTGGRFLDSLAYSDQWVAIRVKPISQSISLAVVPRSDGFPVQGKEIRSLGVAQSGASKRILFRRYYKSLPSAFDYVILSKEEFIK